MGMYRNPPYYITAYGLAVKQGFEGTLEEWLESLKGRQVQLRFESGALQWRYAAAAGEEEQPWQVLMEIGDLRDEVVNLTLEQAKQYSEAAAAAAENAENDAHRADESSVAATDAAEAAAAALADAKKAIAEGVVSIESLDIGPEGTLIVELSDGRLVTLAGMTAYGIALQNGFDGTESEWLESLRSGADVILAAQAFVEGKYIYGSTGNETSFSSWNASEYIDISRYRGMDCVIHCYMRDYAGFAFYDENKVYIEGVHGSAAGSADPWWMDYATVIPQNAAYIRYTVRPADNDSGSVTVKMKTEYLLDRLDRLEAGAEELQQKVDEASGNAAVTLTAQDFTAGKYIYGRDGREVTYTAWSASEYVDVSAYQGRSCTVRCYMRDFAGFAFYDENKVYLSGVDGYDAEAGSPWWVDYAVEIPANACYIRYTVNPADGDNGSITVEVNVQDLADKIAKLEAGAVMGQVPYAYALTKVLCIGDSLTNGAYYASGRTDLQVGITQDYPQVLSRMLNAEVTNAGVNGAKASTWWKNRAENYDFTQYDSFIIWLGTNAGFTDTLDTDVTPYGESYADFAETETGYLCRIVQKIRTDNASCFIAIGTIFASNDDVAISNTVIRKVAEKYGLTVIDFSNLTSAAYPKLHNEITNCHFNKAGNIYIAHRIVETINEALNADPMGCEFGMTAQ